MQRDLFDLPEYLAELAARAPVREIAKPKWLRVRLAADIVEQLHELDDMPEKLESLIRDAIERGRLK